MDHLRDMALFVEVAKGKSFTKAGAALGVPNSSLSRRIASLEKAIGLKLLNRTTRRIELTEAGQVYYERCRNIVAEAHAAGEELRELVEQPAGVLKVAMSPDFGMLFAELLFKTFARKYPRIAFDLNLTSRYVDVMSEPVDVAIRMGDVPDARIFARRIAVGTRHLYAAPSYVRERGEPRRPSDLADHDCIVFKPDNADVTWTLSRGSKRHVVQPHGRFTANNMGMAHRLAVLGMGIASIADEHAAAELDAGHLKRVLPAWSPPALPIYAVTSSTLVPTRVRLFIEFLVQNIRPPPRSRRLT